MKKQDLKTGMKIVTREEKEYIVFLDIDLVNDSANNFVLSSDGWNELDSYDDNLVNRNGNIEFDVFEVYSPCYPGSIRRTLNSDFSQSHDWILVWKRDGNKDRQIERKIKELERELNDLKVNFYGKL